MTYAYDSILILGGGVDLSGNPLPWVVERLKVAAAIDGEAMLCCLSGFTPHKPPPRDANGFPITESSAGARRLLALGVPAARVLFETSSVDTIGNAYFARTIHAEVLGWRRLLVVTSCFHMPRTRAIFESVFSLPVAPGVASGYELAFKETADVGMSSEHRAARLEKEERSLRQWNSMWTSSAFRTLGDFHRWLFAEHACYAAGRTPARIAGPGGATY